MSVRAGRAATSSESRSSAEDPSPGSVGSSAGGGRRFHIEGTALVVGILRTAFQFCADNGRSAVLRFILRRQCSRGQHTDQQAQGQQTRQDSATIRLPFALLFHNVVSLLILSTESTFRILPGHHLWAGCERKWKNIRPHHSKKE